MSTVKEKSAELLAELRDLCDKNAIEYWLSPRTAACAYAYNGYGEEFFIPGIVMTINDALRLKGLVDSGAVENRTIECMENNPEFTTFSMTYVNENTTLIDIIRGSDYSKHGVRVNIDILRPLVEDKALRRQETLWECTGYLRVLSVKRQKLNKPAQTYVNIRKRMGGSAALFKKMCKKYQDADSDKYYLKLYYMKGVTLNRSLFDHSCDVLFEGESYRVPEPVEKYLQNSTRGAWKAMLEEPPQKVKTFIYYDYVPYSEIESRFASDGDSIYNFFNRNRDWYNSSTEQVKYNSEKKRLWDLAMRSGMRAILFNDLNKNIDIIRLLYQERNYLELEKYFEEYDKELHRMLNLGLGLCPNLELLDIECALMEARGEGATAKKVRALVPEQHFNSPLGD